MKGVVVCPAVEAVDIGKRILEDCGNAIDAADATAAAAAFSFPFRCGFFHPLQLHVGVEACLHEEYMASFSNFLLRGKLFTWFFLSEMRWMLVGRLNSPGVM